jgi:hypothetical protein
MTVREALVAVIEESQGGFADYAKTYAQAALELGEATDGVVVTAERGGVGIIGICPKKTGKMMVGEEMRVQILYVLSNLQGWRGDRAREVKEVLKKASK